jgi:hypothetical protein
VAYVKIGNWWQKRSGQGKTLIVLFVILPLQILALLGTPALAAWAERLLHTPGGEEWGTFGTILWELCFCGLTLLAIGFAAMWRLARRMAEKKGARKDSND